MWSGYMPSSKGRKIGQADGKKKPDPKVWLFLACLPDQLLTRLRYSFVRVSISILSPMAQNSGTFSS